MLQQGLCVSTSPAPLIPAPHTLPCDPQVIYLSGPAAPGLQTKLKQVFHDLDVDVKRHDVNGGVDSGSLEDVFYVKGPKGKLTDAEIKRACTVLEGIVQKQAAVSHAGVRPKFQTQTIAPDPAKREVLYAIMGERRGARRGGGCGVGAPPRRPPSVGGWGYSVRWAALRSTTPATARPLFSHPLTHPFPPHPAPAPRQVQGERRDDHPAGHRVARRVHARAHPPGARGGAARRSAAQRSAARHSLSAAAALQQRWHHSHQLLAAQRSRRHACARSRSLALARLLEQHGACSGSLALARLLQQHGGLRWQP